MEKFCIVTGCHSKENLTSFPVKNLELVLKWVGALKQLGLLQMTLSQLASLKVCSRHFEEKWLVPKTEQGRKRSVYFGAIPRVNLSDGKNTYVMVRQGSLTG